MKTIPYNLTLDGGRFTTRMEIVDTLSRLYKGGDVVAEVQHNADGSFDILQGSMGLVSDMLEMRDVLLRRTAHLRN